MMLAVFGWLGFAAVLVATLILWGVYIRTRRLSNRLLAVASKDFLGASNSLLESADELPEAILDALGIMNRTAMAPDGHWQLLSSLKDKMNGKSVPASNIRAFNSEISGMREELRDLFNKAVTAWLNYLTHQNVWVFLKIGLAVLKIKSSSSHVPSEQASGLAFLNSIKPNAC